MARTEEDPPPLVQDLTFEMDCPECKAETDHVEYDDERTCLECGRVNQSLGYIAGRYVWVRPLGTEKQ